jgi:hypothetical protein
MSLRISFHNGRLQMKLGRSAKLAYRWYFGEGEAMRVA